MPQRSDCALSFESFNCERPQDAKLSPMETKPPQYAYSLLKPASTKALMGFIRILSTESPLHQRVGEAWAWGASRPSDTLEAMRRISSLSSGSSRENSTRSR